MSGRGGGNTVPVGFRCDKEKRLLLNKLVEDGRFPSISAAMNRAVDMLLSRYRGGC